MRPESKRMPRRYSRHYYDLYRLGHSPVLEGALGDTTLLKRVVAFKEKFYRTPWARLDIRFDGDFVQIKPCSNSPFRVSGVTNPGLFPEGKPPKAFVDGTAAPSRPRNPGLASALYKAGYIETYGSGIRRIRDLCAEAGVRFSYRQEHGCTSIAFERPGSQVEGEADDAMSIQEDRSEAFGRSMVCAGAI